MASLTDRPLCTVVLEAIFPSVWRANGVQSPKASTTRGRKTPPAASTEDECLESFDASARNPADPAETEERLTLPGVRGPQTETSKYVGRPSAKVEWKMSPGLSLLWPEILCSLQTERSSRRRAW